MGSLSPSAQPISQPAPVVVQSAPIPTVDPAITAQSEADAAAEVAKQREDNLLRRSRGRAGTIQTSFRGLLGQAADSSQKKTLFGE